MNNFLVKLAVSIVGDDKTNINIPALTGEEVLRNGLNIAYFIAGTVAIIVIIVGGIMYASAAGNSANITKAKNMILYSIVGLVVVVAAYAITNYVIGKFN